MNRKVLRNTAESVTKPKRILIDVTHDMHQTVKCRATKKNLSIREWVLVAITERINREMIEEI